MAKRGEVQEWKVAVKGGRVDGNGFRNSYAGLDTACSNARICARARLGEPVASVEVTSKLTGDVAFVFYGEAVPASEQLYVTPGKDYEFWALALGDAE